MRLVECDPDPCEGQREIAVVLGSPVRLSQPRSQTSGQIDDHDLVGSDATRRCLVSHRGDCGGSSARPCAQALAMGAQVSCRTMRKLGIAAFSGSAPSTTAACATPAG